MNSAHEMLSTLGQALASAQDAAFEQWKAQHPSGRAEFLMRVTAREAERRRRVRRRLWVGAPVLALAAAVLAAVALPESWRDDAELTFDVEDTPGVAQSWIAAPSERAVALEFSDGSRVDLQSQSRARVLELRDNGARVVLESGIAEVEVEPRPENWWVIDAGPYRVEVLGTAFRVQWDAAEERFALDLHHGRVRVTGPTLAEPRFVSSGEHLEMWETPEVPDDEPEVAIVEDRAVDRDRPEPSASTSPAQAPAEGRRKPAEDPRWRAAARRGHFKRALADAEAQGFERLCATLPASTLLELADVARYAHAPAKARQALLALRRRFPGQEAAATAAFDLGRLSQRNCVDARRWLETYLAEQPHGKMASLAKRRLEECSS